MLRNILVSTFVCCLLALCTVFVIMPKSKGPTKTVRYAPVKDPDNVYTLPAEDTKHEGTWLQWPHDFGWDRRHVKRYEASWVELAETLHVGENIHIIAYNDHERRRIRGLLQRRGLLMSKIDFYVYPTDDVWVRDNGPVFAFDQNGNTVVEDWSFNGWGNKADWRFDDRIPQNVAREMNTEAESVSMVNEGGSIEVDGRGTLMAKRSSVLNDNRNPRWTQANAEEYFRRYLGVTNFIWLDGRKGSDVTDDHIDGTARFANGSVIVTMSKADLLDPSEFDVLTDARNADGDRYDIVTLPITTRKVPGTHDHGVFVNYYVGNEAVVVPAFDDPNDAVAAKVLQGLYPDRRTVSIDFREVYQDGGLVHCVTMQQPTGVQRPEQA